MNVERTLVLIKPNGRKRGLVGEIIRRYELKGLVIVGIKQFYFNEARLRRFYREHVGKKFFPMLLQAMTDGPTIAIVLEGHDAIKVVRVLNGATNPSEASPGTIRGDMGRDISDNVVHGSANQHDAEHEIRVLFRAAELSA